MSGLGLLIRILLRYGSGALAAKGLMSIADSESLASDEQVIAFIEMAVSGVAAFVAERWRVLAKRYGWPT